MTTFVARNGVAIRAHPDRINVGGDWLTREQADAVHEFLSGEAHAAKPRPWNLAKTGDVWLLTTQRDGDTRPRTRLPNGEWGAFDGGRVTALPGSFFVTGNALWSAP